MSEPKLLMLGALDTCEPRVFELAADELDALADSAALRELETRGAAGGDLLPDAVKPIEYAFGKDQRTAFQAADFATYDEKIRRL